MFSSWLARLAKFALLYLSSLGCSGTLPKDNGRTYQLAYQLEYTVFSLKANQLQSAYQPALIPAE